MSLRVLVVFDSRARTTRRVARALARELDADVEETHGPPRRVGFFGWLQTKLGDPTARASHMHTFHDLSEYDLVVLSSHVASGRVSAAIEAYARDGRDTLPPVAFACTKDRGACHRGFTHLREICGKAPLAVLEVREADSAGVAVRIASFSDALRRLAPLELAPPLAAVSSGTEASHAEGAA